MILTGRVKNGVVILPGDSSLPEGAVVSVTFPAATSAPPPLEKRRIQVPLVRTGHPATVKLTGEGIATILDDEDAARR